MTLVTMGETGAVQLPAEVRGRYGLTAETSFRLIETAGGILLVPQTQGPMNAELARELEEWEALSAEAWNMAPAEAGTPEALLAAMAAEPHVTAEDVAILDAAIAGGRKLRKPDPLFTGPASGASHGPGENGE